MPAEQFPVEAGHIMMFARAVGDPNPVYYDADAATEVEGIIAPPTFAQSSAQFTPGYPLRPEIGKVWFGSGSMPSGRMKDRPADGEGSSGRSGGGNGGGLHAEQHFTYHRHLRPGDVLSSTVVPGESWQKQSRRAGTLSFTETITEYRDQNSELVITARGIGVRTEKVVEN
jgi:hypothetical protein